MFVSLMWSVIGLIVWLDCRMNDRVVSSAFESSEPPNHRRARGEMLT